MKKIILLFLLATTVHCGPSLKTADSKISYFMGAQLGKSLKSLQEKQKMTIKIDSLMKGIKDFVDGKEKAEMDRVRKAVQKFQAEPNDTNADEFLYAIGLQVGQQAKQMKEAGMKFEADTMKAGVHDGMKDKSKLEEKDVEEAMKTMQQAMSKANKTKGETFLKKHKEEEGIKVTDSGLQYKVVRPGSGRSPKDGQTVKVHYRGTLIDGTEFDSSYKRKEPAEFNINQVIPGWTEALKLMKPGAFYQLAIPSNLGYGDRGTNNIPPASVLLFDVELLSIK